MTGVELKGLKRLRELDFLVADSKKPSQIEKIAYLSVQNIIAGQYQPRVQFDENALSELSASIKVNGILQPLIVRQIHPSQYEIIAGERRYRAAILAKLETIPVIIRNVSDNTALAFALIENIQRADLNALEEAQAYEKLQNEFGLTHVQIAEKVGKSRATVSNLMRLLSLEETVKEQLRVGAIEMGHARALLSLDPEMQIIAVESVITRCLSVRDTEKLVNRLKDEEVKQADNLKPLLAGKCATWSAVLTEKLSTKVSVKLNNGGEGRVVIQVHSPDEVEWLVKLLNK